MSISLPNGTFLATASSNNHSVSAAVTRILRLSNFPPELKTRDIQAIFKDWENDKGGFRIKWMDDVNALVVFSDATVAKRAYLSILLDTPPTFPPPATIRPYDRPDAAQIIATLTARTLGHRAGVSSTYNPSMSVSQEANPALNGHHRSGSNMSSISGMNGMNGMNGANGVNGGLNGFTMPLKGRPMPSTGRLGHSRTGSASSSWARGAGGGALNFAMPPSQNAGRLPTHSEASSADQSRPSSTDSESTEPVVVMDSAFPRTGTRLPPVGGGLGSLAERRESVSADKAMREVEKALASVEAQG